MKKYTICRKKDWDQIEAAKICEKMRPFHADITAEAKVCYDDENLYVQLSAKEKEIRAELTGDYDMVCRDSCLEFFFSPDPMSERYLNIEMNPNCSVFLGLGCGPKDCVRLLPLSRKRYGFHAVSERSEDGWSVTYAVPFILIRLFFSDFSPCPGLKIRGNFYKCGDECVEPHYLSWNPVKEQPGGGSFHYPPCFGELEFE